MIAQRYSNPARLQLSPIPVSVSWRRHCFLGLASGLIVHCDLLRMAISVQVRKCLEWFRPHHLSR